MSFEEQPPEKPIESIAKGATKAVIEWTEEKIKDIVKKFSNKELAFIENPEIIDLVKEQRSTTEWSLFEKYIEDKDLHVLFQMGLSLRRLEKQEEFLAMDSLRGKIFNKYDIEGLHFAQTVQNGIFNKYLGSVLERFTTPAKLTFEILKLIKEIENRVVFIKSEDDIQKRTNEIVSKINAHSPRTFIISSAKKSAMENCEKIKNNVMERISNYDNENYEAEDKKIYFLNRKDDTKSI